MVVNKIDLRSSYVQSKCSDATSARKCKRGSQHDEDYIPDESPPPSKRRRTHDLPWRMPTRAWIAPDPPPRPSVPASVQILIDRQEAALDHLGDGSEEGAKIRAHLEWLEALPWSRSPPQHINLQTLREHLDAEHFGLHEVKDRILEEMALRQRTGKPQRTILCLVGKPGVGKTSIAQSIAHALEAEERKQGATAGKMLVRRSVGGVCNESEVRGHHRAYIGSTPGRIMQGMREAKRSNPVFVLDEIDKIGAGNGMGDVSAALLEVLDPEQNHAFADHYIEHPFDLSDVLFICTANSLQSMQPALRDRLEIIDVPSYSDADKFEIAKRYLIPKLMQEACIEHLRIRWDDAAIRGLVHGYTWEPGVRKLQREIATICRKIAFADSRGQASTDVTPASLVDYLGEAQVPPQRLFDRPQVGGVHALYATHGDGGGVLRLVARPISKPRLKATGLQRQSMRECMDIAYTYLTAPGGRCHELARRHGLHISISDGGTRKDGPSAGVAAVACMASAFLGVPVDHTLAMTGEVELDGHVAAVGGIPEKLAGAFRAGIRHVLIPRANAADVARLKPYTERGLRVTLVDTCDDVLRHALLRTQTSQAQKRNMPPA